MKNYFVLMVTIFLFSCGASEEDKKKQSMDIAKEKGEEYCECILKSKEDTDGQIKCRHDIKLEFIKELDALELSEEQFKEAEKVFDLIHDKCDVEVNGNMDPKMQEALDEYNRSK